MFRGSVKWYWLPTPFASFTFTSPPVRRRVPSHFTWGLLSGTVRYYSSLLSDIYGHLKFANRIVLTQNLMFLSTSPTVHLTVTSRRFEHSKLNCDKFSKSCILEDLLACENFDFLKTHKNGCTLCETHFTRAPTDYKFSVVAKHSSSFPCNNAATVSPTEGYPTSPPLF